MKFEDFDRLCDTLNAQINADSLFSNGLTFGYVQILIQVYLLDEQNADFNKLQNHLNNLINCKTLSLNTNVKITNLLLKFKTNNDGVSECIAALKKNQSNIKFLSNHRNTKEAGNLTTLNNEIEKLSSGNKEHEIEVFNKMSEYINLATKIGSFQQLKKAVHFILIANKFAEKYNLEQIKLSTYQKIEQRYIEYGVEEYLKKEKRLTKENNRFSSNFIDINNLHPNFPKFEFDNKWILNLSSLQLDYAIENYKKISINDIENILKSTLEIAIKINSKKKSSGVEKYFLINRVEKFKQNLKIIRKKTSERLEGNKLNEIPSILSDYTQKIIKLILEMIKEIEKILPYSQDRQFSLALIGSGSRDEMCYFSDLEFFILVEEDSPENLHYFKDFVNLLELLIIMLGETPHNLWAHFKFAVPRGLRFDDGFNVPFSNKILYGTPEQLMKNYSLQANSIPDIILANALLEPHLIYGSESLYNNFLQLQITTINKSIPNNPRKSIKDILIDELLHILLRDYKIQGSKNLDAKAHLTRLIIFGINLIAHHHRILVANTWRKIDQLKSKKIISIQTAELLADALSLGFEIRMHLHWGNQGEIEDLNLNLSPDHLSKFKKQLTNKESLVESIQTGVIEPFREYLEHFSINKEVRLDDNKNQPCSANFYASLAQHTIFIGQKLEAIYYYLKAANLDKNNDSLQDYLSDCLQSYLQLKRLDDYICDKIIISSEKKAEIALGILKEKSTNDEFMQKLGKWIELFASNVNKKTESALKLEIYKILLLITSDSLYFQVADYIKNKLNILNQILNQNNLNTTFLHNIPNANGYRESKNTPLSSKHFLTSEKAGSISVNLVTRAAVKSIEIDPNILDSSQSSHTTGPIIGLKSTNSNNQHGIYVEKKLEKIVSHYISTTLAEFIIGDPQPRSAIIQTTDNKPILCIEKKNLIQFHPNSTNRANLEAREFSLNILFCLATFSSCIDVSDLYISSLNKNKHVLTPLLYESYLVSMRPCSSIKYKNILFLLSEMNNIVDQYAIMEFMRLDSNKVFARLAERISSELRIVSENSNNLQFDLHQMKNFFTAQMHLIQNTLTKQPVISHLELLLITLPHAGTYYAKLLDAENIVSPIKRLITIPCDFYNNPNLENFSHNSNGISNNYRIITDIYQGEFEKYKALTILEKQNILGKLNWGALSKHISPKWINSEKNQLSIIEILKNEKKSYNKIDLRGFNKLSFNKLLDILNSHSEVTELLVRMVLSLDELRVISAAACKLKRIVFHPEYKIKNLYFVYSNFPESINTKINATLKIFADDYHCPNERKRSLSLDVNCINTYDIKLIQTYLYTLTLLQNIHIKYTPPRQNSSTDLPRHNMIDFSKIFCLPNLKTFLISGIFLNKNSFLNLIDSLTLNTNLSEFSVEVSYNNNFSNDNINFYSFFQYKNITIFDAKGLLFSANSLITFLEAVKKQAAIRFLTLSCIDFSSIHEKIVDFVGKHLKIESITLEGNGLSSNFINIFISQNKHLKKIILISSTITDEQSFLKNLFKIRRYPVEIEIYSNNFPSNFLLEAKNTVTNKMSDDIKFTSITIGNSIDKIEIKRSNQGNIQATKTRHNKDFYFNHNTSRKFTLSSTDSNRRLSLNNSFRRISSSSKNLMPKINRDSSPRHP